MKPEKILIVDDNVQNIQILGRILSENGYELVIATGGEEAIKILKRIPVDLILLDINMPGLNGYETFEKIREIDKTKDIPIIFISALAEQEEKIKGLQIGASDYITKPFNKTELLLRIKVHLELKTKKEELQKKNEKIQELLRVLLHDLKNPLTGSRSLLELFREDKSLIEESLPMLFYSIDACLNIINSIRELNSIEDGKMELTLVPINLKEAIINANSLLTSKFEMKNISIELHIPEDLKILADQTIFSHSIMSNLIANAIKFSYSNSSIIISAEQKGNYVKISIRDFGIGIPEKLLKDVFSFTKPTSRKGTAGEKGTGYGMPLVNKFIEKLNGSIEIQSEVENEQKKGTEVILTIPSANLAK